MAQRRWTVTEDGIAVPRRALLRGGLASFAGAMMSKLLPGCDSTPVADGGIDGGTGQDAGMPDAGEVMFPMRDVPSPPALRSLIADIGPLGDPDANGVRLPAGFTSRVLARSTQVVTGTDHSWHQFPDGGATFATEDGGWIYVSNAEIPALGGAGALRFDASGALVSAYPILERSNVNCAGGKTPWHTWLSCEEAPRGVVHECDPWGEVGAVVRPALGTFKHEAAAVDPTRGQLYLSEDERDGCLYRFTPERMTAAGLPDLRSGRLDVASVDAAGMVSWLEVPDPRYEGTVPTRLQVAGATAFDGGEGLWYHEDVVYLATKGDTRVWAFDVAASRIDVLYDGKATLDPVLTGVDNVTVSCCGDVLVAEDGGTMDVVAILPTGELKQLLQIVGQDTSEITGPAFDPSGTRLYFSSQRGEGRGITYVVEGPFHAPA